VSGLGTEIAKMQLKARTTAIYLSDAKKNQESNRFNNKNEKPINKDKGHHNNAVITPVSRLITIALITATLHPPALALDERSLTQPPPAAARGVQPVAAVDVERFLGSWYEIARIPAWFQNRCVKDTTAHYQLRRDGKITVINRCVTRGGNIDQANGLARVLDPATTTRLQVSFVSLLGWRPFWGDYWIIGLDPDYRWLVVGDPKRQYGWILSRSSVLEPALLEAAFLSLESNGYARERFVLTPQS
jgi:apolipoprotein D and lipocalin family protein